jgi:hypothetical protein
MWRGCGRLCLSPLGGEGRFERVGSRFERRLCPRAGVLVVRIAGRLPREPEQTWRVAYKCSHWNPLCQVSVRPSRESA